MLSSVPSPDAGPTLLPLLTTSAHICVQKACQSLRKRYGATVHDFGQGRDERSDRMSQVECREGRQIVRDSGRPDTLTPYYSSSEKVSCAIRLPERRASHSSASSRA